MSKNISLAGCFPPIPTPFDDKGRVDHEQLALNLEKWQKTSLTGFAVLGSNGEAVMLRTEEKLEIWKTAGQAIDSDHLFIAGTGCESTLETLELTKKAASLGADAAMVVTPHYYKSRMDYDALVSHYTSPPSSGRTYGEIPQGGNGNRSGNPALSYPSQWRCNRAVWYPGVKSCHGSDRYVWGPGPVSFERHYQRTERRTKRDTGQCGDTLRYRNYSGG